MQYRWSFVMMSIGSIAIAAGELLAVFVLFARFGSLRGWTLAQVAFFYGGVEHGRGVWRSSCSGASICFRT